MSYRFGVTLVDVGDIWEGFGSISHVLLTHAHFDHVYGLNELLQVSPDTKVYTNDYGKEMLLDAKKNLSCFNETPFIFSSPDQIVVVEDGETVNLNEDLSAKSIFTPGHNPSCITWIVGNAIFTGDAYIPDIKTVTNLPGGNKHQAEESLAMIKSMTEGRIVYPGHKLK